ncbi:YggT family protein [Priestia koreensis]|uniref:YggT family protein n=1 Tax=Priestia koreensis TaxID=284581 RepID=A0A0M0KQQ5_9BACI|nr:YggT family protein [Priestia koreensis]KOO40723.1 hypothetical protein AMD01_20675 [Priestia koreensis]
MILFEQIVLQLLEIYSWALIIYILMSWVPSIQESVFGRFLGAICEPYLAPFRRIIPPIGGMLDISPIVAIFLLNFAKAGVRTLFGIV